MITIHCDKEDCNNSVELENVMGQPPVGWGRISVVKLVRFDITKDRNAAAMLAMYKAAAKENDNPGLRKMVGAMRSMELPAQPTPFVAHICPTCMESISLGRVHLDGGVL